MDTPCPNFGGRYERGKMTGERTLRIVGYVYRVEESCYDYADVKDEKYNSLLVIPLLEFKGKRVEVTVKILEDDEQEAQE